MIFKLEIATDNAAFDGPDTRDHEVARILNEAAKRLRQGFDSGRCIDFNGNVVGEFAYSD